MDEIKEVQTIREKMENNILLEFKRDFMESVKTDKIIVDRKWREKIEKHLMNDYGISVEEFIENFKYCGGDTGSHFNYWNMINCLDKDTPFHKDNCICDHFIYENCYAVDKRDKNKIVVLGNCCIKRFLGNNAGRTCEKCGKKHKNRKNNLCKECRNNEKNNDDFKLCGNNDCEKLIKKKYKYCYSCYIK